MREATRTPWTLASLVLTGVAAASGAAGVIHFAAVGEHWRTYRMAGIFFVLIGAFQVVWAVLIARQPTRVLYLAGAAANAATITVWALSRTTGLPFGPSAGIPQPVGAPDAIATVFEELVVIGLIVLVSVDQDPPPLARRTFREAVALMAVVAIPATIWALSVMHGGGGPVDRARMPRLAGDPAPRAGAARAAAGGALLLYLTAAARTGRPGLWSFNRKRGNDHGHPVRRGSPVAAASQRYPPNAAAQPPVIAAGPGAEPGPLSRRLAAASVGTAHPVPTKWRTEGR
ncbi:MAG TPA: hypothetical protein VII47_08085 [Actinomycetota bacterium]